jgi:hypothetical protein
MLNLSEMILYLIPSSPPPSSDIYRATAILKRTTQFKYLKIFIFSNSIIKLIYIVLTV